jgi:hypothetical protein
MRLPFFSLILSRSIYSAQYSATPVRTNLGLSVRVRRLLDRSTSAGCADSSARQLSSFLATLYCVFSSDSFRMSDL